MQKLTRNGKLHISYTCVCVCKNVCSVQSVVALGILYKLGLKHFLLGMWIAQSYWYTPALLLSAFAVSDRVDNGICNGSLLTDYLSLSIITYYSELVSTCRSYDCERLLSELELSPFISINNYIRF